MSDYHSTSGADPLRRKIGVSPIFSRDTRPF